MKGFLILIMAGLFSVTAFGQQSQIDYPDSGFTNKAEAKNLLVNDKKEGKWIEYYNQIDGLTLTADTNAVIYMLTVYKKGKIYGIVRTYNKEKLTAEVPYAKNKANGLAKYYYSDGKLQMETRYKNGKGVFTKYYDKNGIERLVD